VTSGCFIEHLEIYLPEKEVTNMELKEEFPDWNMDLFEKTVGVKSRHEVKEDETASDIAFQAALKLFEKIDKNRIDFLILCTQYPDYYKPTTACLLQQRLGLKNTIGAYDINLGCSGFVYGLAVAKGLIKGNIAHHVLLLTSTSASKYIHPRDRSKRSLFGDAATACLISPSEKDQILEFEFGTDGNNTDLVIPNGAFRKRYDPDAVEFEYEAGSFTTDNHVQMNGHEIMNFTLRVVPSLVRNVLKKNGMTLGDIHYTVFHQANPFILDHLRKRCGIQADKFFNDIGNTGNTSSSSIPIGIKRLAEDGKIGPGDKLLLAGFGVGLSWAATIIEY
jgi:3-oxoacyl-[acyl-carrier-protein] synthase-3